MHTIPHAVALPASAPMRASPGGLLHTAENALLAAAFSALVVLPLAEIALRALFGIGIQGVASVVQHLTLVVGMLGAAVAAREDRLLGFSAASLLPQRYAAHARLVAFGCAAAAGAMLCASGFQFVKAEVEAGARLVYGIPVWAIQSILPAGFALITVRLLRHAAPDLRGRGFALLLAASLVAFACFAAVSRESIATAGLAVAFAALLAGAPLFAVIGAAALLLLWSTGVPIASVAVDQYSLANNPTLPAIPLFTLAGYILAESGAPRRLIEVFDALFGRFRGGAAIVTVLVCTFFTSFTGASGVTILALGGLAMPLLLASGFRERAALGLITGGGVPGVLLFPALPLILYAIVAKTSMEDMFVGALIPAAVMLSITLLWGLLQQRAASGPTKPFNGERLRWAALAAKWELALPIIPIGILLGGFATPVEAAAATALYAYITTGPVHKEVRVYPDLPRITTECGLLVGGILLILGVSLALTNFLVDAQVPDKAVDWVMSHIKSPWVFLLALNVFLLLVGCVMDIFSAIVIITPLIVPVGLAFGVNPVHLGIIFLANMELGYLTPPVGLNLFFASYRFGKPLPEVCRSVTSLFMALLLGVLAITYLPWLSTGLLGMLR
jgi:C4-dicarboxylate transporter DctM subunit